MIPLAAIAALLGACTGDAGEDRDNSGQQEAEGDVLGGSISDAMIPVETLRSQSPTLRAAPAPEEDEAVSEEEGSTEEVGTPETEAPPAQPSEVET